MALPLPDQSQTVKPPPGPPPSPDEWEKAQPVPQSVAPTPQSKASDATPPQGPVAPPPDAAQIMLGKDWQGAPTILPARPEGAMGLGPGPMSPSSANSVLELLTTGMELAGMMYGPARVAPMITELPAAARMATRIVAAGFGGAGGSLVGNTLITPPTEGGAGEIARRASEAGVQGMVGEGLGVGVQAATKLPGVRAVAERIRAPFQSSITPAGREATEFLGGQVTPSQVNPHTAVNVAENIVEGSIFGGGRYRTFLQEQTKLLEQKADEILSQFRRGGGAAGATSRVPRPMTPEVAGKTFQDLTETAHQTAKNAAGRLYEDVDRLSEGVKVSLDPLKTFVEEETARRGVLSTQLTGGKTASTIKNVERAVIPPEDPAMAELKEYVGNAGVGSQAERDKLFQTLAGTLSEAGVSAEQAAAGEVTFRQAHEIRSALGRLVRQANRSGDAQLRGVASQFLKRIDESMTAAAGKPGAPLRVAYDTATKAWKAMAETYERGLLAKAAKVEPRVVVQELIKPGRVQDINRARAAVGIDGWKAVQEAHTRQLLYNADGSLRTGKQIATALGRLGNETVAAVYPRGVDQSLHQFARVLTQIQQPRKGPGKMAVQLTQGGVATGLLVFQGDPVKAGVVLLGPAAIARAILSPTGRRWLTTGLQATKAGDATTAARVTGQLVAWLAKEGVLDVEGPPEGPGSLERPPSMPEGPGPQGLPQPGATGRAAGPGPLAGPPRF